jgi:orotate phosphoribosyltransferase
MKSKEEIIELLKDVGAIKEGHFQLASGRHSGHYVQCAQLGQYPEKLQGLLEGVSERINNLGAIDTVFFPAIGALQVGQQLGLALKKRAIFAERNANNEMELRRGFEIHEGESLLLAEDVITTGGTLKETLKFAEEKNAKIVGVFCIINRSGKSDWQGLPLISVVDLDFPTYAEDEVPEELARIPLYRPGTKKV